MFFASWLCRYLLLPTTASFSIQSHHHPYRIISYTSTSTSISTALSAVKIWLEEAEEGFVDDDENLMTGEICLRAVKAFASSDDPDDDEQSEQSNQRFLCAGALVQRPDSNICDAWMADSLLDEANVQFQGCVLVLDDLFAFHLKRSNACDLDGLVSNFIVQCGRLESEYHCASFMSAQFRGFRPLKDLWMLLEDDKIEIESVGSVGINNREGKNKNKYSYVNHFSDEIEDPDAMIFDAQQHGLEKCNYGELSSHNTQSIINIMQRVQMNQTESVLE